MYAIPHQFVAEIAAQRRAHLQQQAQAHAAARAVRRRSPQHPSLAPVPRWRRIVGAPGAVAPVSP